MARMSCGQRGELFAATRLKCSSSILLAKRADRSTLPVAQAEQNRRHFRFNASMTKKISRAAVFVGVLEKERPAPVCIGPRTTPSAGRCCRQRSGRGGAGCAENKLRRRPRAGTRGGRWREAKHGKRRGAP